MCGEEGKDKNEEGEERKYTHMELDEKRALGEGVAVARHAFVGNAPHVA